MAGKALTEAAVERISRPLKGRKEVGDMQKGLFLVVYPTGLKSWLVVYRMPGPDGRLTQGHKLTIGQWPTMTISAARKEAERIVDAAHKGISPEVVAGITFRAVAEAFVKAMKAGAPTGRRRPVTPTTATAREAKLNRYVLPVLGSLAMDKITNGHVARLLANIDKAGGPVDETMKVIRLTYSFALSRGLYHGPMPTAGMTKRQPKQKERRALTDSQLKAIWHAAEDYRFVRLLMLTGQRLREIAEARWDEVDWERKLLIVPAARVKNRSGAHEVPLSESALEVLRKAQETCALLGNGSGYVFPSTRGETPVSGFTKMKLRIDRLMAKAGVAFPWSQHDLRHTFITRVRDGEENAEGEIVWSVPLEVLQATVNHEITAGVTRVYDHGDINRRYRLQKRQLLDWWGRKVTAIYSQN